MRLLLRSLATVLLLLVHKSTADIPGCDFYDTVDISKDQKFSNGSYHHEGLLIPAFLVGEYNFKLFPNGSKEDVPSHVRGCVCKLKPCLRFCCPLYHKINDSVCSDEMSKDELKSHNPYVNLTLNDGTVAKRHFKDDLIVQSDLPIPCNDMYYIDHTLPDNGFSLFENGTLFIPYYGWYLGKREYCVQHFDFKGDSIRIAPHFCPADPEAKAETETKVAPSQLGLIIVMIISMISIVLTISVYLNVKKLRNLLGQCLMCYVVALFMGYLFLIFNLWDVWAKPSSACTTSGFLGHFFILAAFFWLSVISFRLWNTFGGASHSVNRFLPENRFQAYNSFAWGTPLLLSGVTILADFVIENKEWAPRVGTSQCWMHTEDHTTYLYYHGPITLLIVFNIFMFILTAIRITKVRKEVNNFAQQNRRNQQINADSQNSTLFLRLFIIMGLTWSLELIFFSLQGNQFWDKLAIVPDYINSSQGTIIFVLFVLTPSTLKLLKERIKGNKDEDPDNEEQISLGNTKFDQSILWSYISLELIFFSLQGNQFWDKLAIVPDYINSSQGTIIFVLFVLTPSTLKLLKERIKGNKDEDPDNEEQISLGNTKFDQSILWSYISLELIFFSLQGNQFWDKLAIVPDYINSSQGTIIFVLFVLTPSTLKLLKERIKGNKDEDPDNEEQISLGNTKFDQSILQ
ncbi:probable G-protein coupled receptor Mth-like 3 [Drosophila takahashii]|uniref:probable G-protein coupled receptor Mth-like 3 n=1 Tax=Drosophila takahashii TaxID=29030 RepID=UPI0038994911